ncbi:hypothetical protein I601_2427 [Nocardioides dokdonensis FR1436]|uniref:Prenyltransferase and squalene oxidase repeat protein n=1 Tax=Nocardioides dokdonensis FR1436 TaxID=1300347 RepID=A0A1A9GN13_9ACTN|nr:hypothetical protein [Nocardioides dokdonensis]ANH38845.1 hypothetical protein I601_2427 [Nocardioides dokdonensis FR1436]
MSLRLTRGVALVATTAALALVATTTPAVAGPVRDQKQASRWLSGQLTDGLVHNDQYDFTDYGLSVDVGLALHAQERRGGTVTAIRDALAGGVDSYTTGVDWGSGDVYAGATAKLTSFVARTDGDPASFGGVDLVERLEGLVSTEAPTTGRLQDVTTSDDYANTIGQAFAAQALDAVGSDAAAPVTSFLLDQQCEAGYFRLGFSRKDSVDQTCDGDPRDAGKPDQGADVTALVLISLDALENPSAQVQDAVERGSAWLAAQQRKGGSFDDGYAGSNANSTGLAGWALGETGRCGKAQKAARWVQKQQAGSKDKALSADKGVIAYDRKALLTGRKDGIEVTTRDQFRRATAQAAPALDNLRKKQCKA